MTTNVSILRPQGRLDSATSPALEAEIARTIADGADRLLLDLGELSYISSAGLRIVLQAAKQMKSRGGRFALCALNAPIREIFDISGFSGFLDISPSQDEAVARLSQ
ncbi:MAG: STAS domain-containing protein [Pseudolabrys sp.]